MLALSTFIREGTPVPFEVRCAGVGIRIVSNLEYIDRCDLDA